MGRVHSAVHKYSSCYDGTNRTESYADELWVRRMAARIMLRAVEDWINLLHVQAKIDADEPAKRITSYKFHRCGNSSFAEIVAFISGEYGGMMCDVLDIDSDAIINKLRKWKRDYEQTGKIPKCTFYVQEDAD